MNNDLWELVSDCVHPKHGKGIVYLRLYVANYTMLKYEYKDSYVEYFEINCLGRKKKSKYGFLKKETVA